ncbi:Tyrosine recombinase XerC [bacterium HR28]|nr:Tyrosine recombinase XerC [bacterium HR28]
MAERRGRSYSKRVWVLDPATGQRKQVRITARTKKELAEKEAKLRLGDAPLAPASLTVADFLAHYLAVARLSEATRRSYQQAAKRFVLPLLGGLKLRQVTGFHVQQVFQAASGSSYAQQVGALVRGLFRLAVREGLLPRSPADGLEGPAPARTERTARAWTLDELRRFLAVAAQHRYGRFFFVLATTGLRVSEACNLRWSDVDLAAAALFVRRSKSAAGRRRIALDPATIQVLAAQQAEQARRRQLLGPAWQEHDAVFDRGDGTPLAVRTVQAVMQTLVARAGLTGTPHTLRHTHATLLLERGVPVHLVQQRLGHSTSRITLDAYAHALPPAERLLVTELATLAEHEVGDHLVTIRALNAE